MVTSERINDIVKNADAYKKMGFDKMTIIQGIDIVKNNKILPVSTIFIEDQDGHILFIADYCSAIETKDIKKQLKDNLDIKKCDVFNIVVNPLPEFYQKIIAYIIYSDPYLRPIIYGDSVSVNNNKIEIKNGKILVNKKELSVEQFLDSIYGENYIDNKDSFLTKVSDKENKIKELLNEIHRLKELVSKYYIVPKMIDEEGKIYKGFLIRDKNGKYCAKIIKNDRLEDTNDFVISSNLSWNDFINAILNLK